MIFNTGEEKRTKKKKLHSSLSFLVCQGGGRKRGKSLQHFEISRTNSAEILVGRHYQYKGGIESASKNLF